MISTWRKANPTVIPFRYHATLQRSYRRDSSLTGVEVAVLGKVGGNIIELVHRVVALVAVELDAGGDVDHEGGQGGDLLQDVLVLLQHERDVGCGEGTREASGNPVKLHSRSKRYKLEGFSTSVRKSLTRVQQGEK